MLTSNNQIFYQFSRATWTFSSRKHHEKCVHHYEIHSRFFSLSDKLILSDVKFNLNRKMRNRNSLNIDVSYPTFSIQTLLSLRYHVHGKEWDGKLFLFSLYLMLIWMIWICVMIGSRQDIYLICIIQQFHFTRFDCRVRKRNGFDMKMMMMMKKADSNLWNFIFRSAFFQWLLQFTSHDFV